MHVKPDLTCSPEYDPMQEIPNKESNKLLASFKFEVSGRYEQGTAHWEAWWLVLLASFKFEVSGRCEQGTAHLSLGGLMISTTRQF